MALVSVASVLALASCHLVVSGVNCPCSLTGMCPSCESGYIGCPWFKLSLGVERVLERMTCEPGNSRTPESQTVSW